MSQFISTTPLIFIIDESRYQDLILGYKLSDNGHLKGLPTTLKFSSISFKDPYVPLTCLSTFKVV